jgi:hypothetical protein
MNASLFDMWNALDQEAWRHRDNSQRHYVDQYQLNTEKLTQTQMARHNRDRTQDREAA